jgi:group I intron endonuclease
MIKFNTTNTIEELQQTGVYTITCTINNKVYVGSAQTSFQKRLYHHFCVLNVNKHKNRYLQNAWNKYGAESFTFDIIEKCDKSFCLSTEQYWMNMLNCTNKSIGYNINPLATSTPSNCRESQLKKSIKMKENYATGKMVSAFKDKEPWNKGISMSNEHKQKLSIAAKNRVCTEEGLKKRRQSIRNGKSEVEVLDINNVSLGIWNSIVDLSEWSIENGHTLPMILRNKEGRNGYSPYILKQQNISHVCNGKVDNYKGLRFRLIAAPTTSDSK